VSRPAITPQTFPVDSLDFKPCLTRKLKFRFFNPDFYILIPVLNSGNSDCTRANAKLETFRQRLWGAPSAQHTPRGVRPAHTQATRRRVTVCTRYILKSHTATRTRPPGHQGPDSPPHRSRRLGCRHAIRVASYNTPKTRRRQGRRAALPIGIL
jgi:hypothetical protein